MAVSASVETEHTSGVMLAHLLILIGPYIGHVMADGLQYMDMKKQTDATLY